ncbi:MAG TPA: hypothetical protein VMG61_02180 [Usitatibacter sp.]|nr:hypothetical protein [Usitatibacter sp.]
MTDGGDKLSKRYRELAREEPSPALDDAILAASRRAVAKPSLARRWGVPVSIAAVLVLAFGLTLEMQHEKPDVSTAPPVSLPSVLPPSAAPMQAPEAEEAPAPKLESATSAARAAPAPAAVAAKPQAFPQKKAQPLAKERAPRDELQAAPAEQKISAPTGAALQYNAPATTAAPPASPRADYNVAPAAPDPGQELERIAQLRADGNDAEADRLLAQFQRRYPGYKIPDAMWERVKPR